MTRRMCIALLLALVGLGIPPAHAGVSPFWQQLGNSATGRGVSLAAPPREVYDVSVAVDTDGRPIVAYAQFADGTAFQGAIVVKRWNGSAWQTLSAAVGQGYLPQVRLSPTGEIFVAWLQDDGTGNSDIRLRKYNGSSFVPIGGSDSPGGITGTNPWITFPFSLAIDPDGHPVVAFLARAVNGVFEPTGTPAIIDFTQQVYVRRWNGAAWVFVGSDFSGGGASHAVSFKAAFGPSIVDGLFGPAEVKSHSQPEPKASGLWDPM